MKTEMEIQKAHDTLKAILFGEVPHPCPGVDLRPAMDMLCWVLGHKPCLWYVLVPEHEIGQA